MQPYLEQYLDSKYLSYPSLELTLPFTTLHVTLVTVNC